MSAFDFGALDRTGKSNTRRELYIGMEKVAIAIAEKKEYELGFPFCIQINGRMGLKFGLDAPFDSEAQGSFI